MFQLISSISEFEMLKGNPLREENLLKLLEGFFAGVFMVLLPKVNHQLKPLIERVMDHSNIPPTLSGALRKLALSNYQNNFNKQKTPLLLTSKRVNNNNRMISVIDPSQKNFNPCCYI